MKKVRVEEAVGMVLPHDLTEIRPGGVKGPAFRKGHVVTEADIPHLKRIGKNHVYVLELGPEELHEDEAALLMAEAVAGEGVEYDRRPSEGKVGFRATREGLLEVDREGLLALNLLGDVMLATRHTHTVVRPGEPLGAGRAIPLVVPRSVVDRAVAVARERGGLLRVRPWVIRSAAVVVTGQEVFEGRIRDAFGPVLTDKLRRFGVEVRSVRLAPDDVGAIRAEIERALAAGAGLVFCTGGMSVDPDDVTRTAIREAGATDVVYGSPVLPGAMFLAARIGEVPVLGIPACGMYFRTTVLDLVLPRVLAGDRLTRADIAALGHGGFCLGCKPCRYPVCPFGKG
ncbi:molybdopterin-binding protein [Dissulfurirhabdus thermomarina]|nr:molybdopterin-binding protein [Dissulfurirhabdus thermomarina]